MAFEPIDANKRIGSDFSVQYGTSAASASSITQNVHNGINNSDYNNTKVINTNNQTNVGAFRGNPFAGNGNLFASTNYNTEGRFGQEASGQITGNYKENPETGQLEKVKLGESLQLFC